MTLLNKFKNEQNRQLQIQAQLAEQSYRAFNGVKQSRENERSGELRKKMNDDLPASSLTKEMIQDYQREQEEEDFYEESHVNLFTPKLNKLYRTVSTSHCTRSFLTLNCRS